MCAVCTCRYDRAHGVSKIRSMCFDASQRRLLTGANDGRVKLWNFSNGNVRKCARYTGYVVEVAPEFTLLSFRGVKLQHRKRLKYVRSYGRSSKRGGSNESTFMEIKKSVT